MILKCIPTGMFASNCYVLGNNGEGVIIDPGASEKDIMDVVEKTGLKIKYILLTHGHLDHICSVDKIRNRTGAKVLVHESDAAALTDSRLNGSAAFGMAASYGSADEFVKDGDILDVGGLMLEIIHTPGHTSGGICIKVGNIVFTGDTLFRLSIGRTDLGDGDYGLIIKSIKNRLMTLEDDVVVYSGHGTSSTIGYERKHNPFIRE